MPFVLFPKQIEWLEWILTGGKTRSQVSLKRAVMVDCHGLP